MKRGTVSARYLSLFIDVSDKDGPKDIDSLYIIQDKLELFWKYNDTSWSEKTVGKERWIGSNKIQMPDNTDLPSGTYRIVVIDSGGDRDTREIFIPESAPSRKLPGLTLLENGSFLVDSVYKENYIFLKNAGGQVVKSMKVVSGAIPAELVLKGIKEKIHTFELYTVDTATNDGYVISIDNNVVLKSF